MNQPETRQDAAAEAEAATGRQSAVAETAKPVKPPAKKAEDKPWPFPPRFKEPKVTVDLDALKARFGGIVTHVGDMSGKPVAYIEPAHALDVLTFCKNDQKMDFLVFVSACDYKDLDLLEVHWQLYSYATNRSLAVKAHIPRATPHIASVVALWAGADWHEREAYDLFGIRFDGHPDLKRIFMPEGWRGHPLLKDYDRTPQYIGMNEEGEDVVYDTPGPYRW